MTLRAAACVMGAYVAAVAAQESPPPPTFPPPPDFGVPQPVPQPVPQAVPQQFPQQFSQPVPIGAPQTSLKRIFADTLATVAATTGATIITGLAQTITGGLTQWFSRKTRPQQAESPAAPAFPQEPAPLQPAPVPAPAGALPPLPAFASVSAPLPPPQFFDAQTGAVSAADPAFAAATAPGATGDALFAGLAYEVHTVDAGGTTTPVNPATHEFRSGDRFVVFYRPTLPGHMEVFNINPAGLRNRIDSVEIAAGQLAKLGPYEFTAMTGDEQLRLVLAPCQTPELFVATRDIINVSTQASSASTLGLSTCGVSTRSIQEVVTRDIRKVAVEGTTGFALDPVSAEERSSGQLAPREVTISFRHR